MSSGFLKVLLGKMENSGISDFFCHFGGVVESDAVKVKNKNCARTETQIHIGPVDNF